LIVHGSSGKGANFRVDSRSHYAILPDTIGNGKSSKPSDEMRAAFPHYNYEDPVCAECHLVTERLRIPHLRIVMGTPLSRLLKSTIRRVRNGTYMGSSGS
jgi:homoserine O-acetyltransferase